MYITTSSFQASKLEIHSPFTPHSHIFLTKPKIPFFSSSSHLRPGRVRHWEARVHEYRKVPYLMRYLVAQYAACGDQARSGGDEEGPAHSQAVGEVVDAVGGEVQVPGDLERYF